MLYKRPQGVSDAFIIENTNTEKFKKLFSEIKLKNLP